MDAYVDEAARATWISTDIRPRHPGRSSSRPTSRPKMPRFTTLFDVSIAELGKDVQIRFNLLG